MTYAGGTSSVSGQPPQRARQYCLPASMSARREVSASVGLSVTTFGPAPSAMSFLSNGPCVQGSGSDLAALRRTFRSFRYGRSGITYRFPAYWRCLTAHIRHQTSISAAIRLARSSPALPLNGTMCGGISERQWQISAARSITSASFSVSSPKMASAIDQTAINPGSLSGGCTDNASPSRFAAPLATPPISVTNNGEIKDFPVVQESHGDGLSPVVDGSFTVSEIFRLPLVTRMRRTARPEDGCPSSAYLRATPHKEKAGLNPDPSLLSNFRGHRLPQSLFRQLQRRPAHVWLTHCEDHVPLSGFQKYPTSDCGPVAKLNHDQLAHRFVSKSSPEPVRPLLVSLQ